MPQHPDSPKPAAPSAAQLWVDTWRRAGPELERIRNEELRNLTDEAALQQAIAVSRLPAGIPLRPTSGLVEFQKWMRRLAEKTGQLKNQAPTQLPNASPHVPEPQVTSSAAAHRRSSPQ